MKFENVGRTISYGSNTVKTRVKTMSETGSLKSQLSAEQRRLDSYFLNLGREYCKLSGRYPIPELSELLGLATESVKKISELNAQIRELENTRTCPRCGIGLDDDSRFCRNCGAPLEAPAPKKQRKCCPECGGSVVADAMFCSKCGKRFE